MNFYLMPHPPIIIPAIGKGEELKLYKTTLACNQIAEEISKLKPQTIIIITPHGPMFSDAICILDDEKIEGDLSQFQCHDVKMSLTFDRELNELILNLSQNRNIPVVSVDQHLLKMYHRRFQLDHGVVVPLYFINEQYRDYQLVHITYAPLKDRQLYEFGMVLQEAVKQLDRQVVMIASGDLSHKLKEANMKYGEEFDRQFLNHLKKGELLELFELDKEVVYQVAECGLRSMKIMSGAMDGGKYEGNVLAYQCPVGVGYGTVKFNYLGVGIKGLKYIEKKPKIKAVSILQKENPYVYVARKALEDYFQQTKTLLTQEDLPSEMFVKRQGVFVSLKKQGQLSGCIGTIFPTTDCVATEIVRNAIAAATQDPRFMPVEEEELTELKVSVDVLTEPISCSKEMLNPKKYGVVVSCGMKKGVLLPDLEGIETVEEQLSIACRKAGIGETESYEIERFEVIRYQEGD